MVRALIAEDEPLLAAELAASLCRLWPEVARPEVVADGASAVRCALALKADVLFLDVRMPGMSGLEAAQALVEDWPHGQPMPLIVFVTAYDQYAVQAFERAAVDYLLKPVQEDRLEQTVRRLQVALAQRFSASSTPIGQGDALIAQLQRLLQAPAPAAPHAPSHLQVIQAGTGNEIRIVPIDEVLYFEAADKYLRVVTSTDEHLIRMSLRELMPRLDAKRFWQIHRGTVVRSDAIASAVRDASGHLHLRLRGHPDRLVVSRLYAHLFKAM